MARLRRADSAGEALRLNPFWQFSTPFGSRDWDTPALARIGERLGDDLELFGGSTKLVAAVVWSLSLETYPTTTDEAGTRFHVDRAEVGPWVRRALDMLADHGLADEEIRAAVGRLSGER